MNIGFKIKRVRLLSGKTQEDVAHKLGITQSAYSKIELGNVDLPFSKLEEIATVLNIPLEYIIGFNENLVFNIKKNNKKVNNGLVINQVAKGEKQVYDEYIASLKTENTYLKAMIEKLLNKK